MRLIWTSLADCDREAIFNYIKVDNPRAAARIDDQIGTQVDRLMSYPETGRLGRVIGTRELVLQRTPYLVAYRIEGDTVRVLRILHGAQKWPDEFR